MSIITNTISNLNATVYKLSNNRITNKGAIEFLKNVK